MEINILRMKDGKCPISYHHIVQGNKETTAQKQQTGKRKYWRRQHMASRQSRRTLQTPEGFLFSFLAALRVDVWCSERVLSMADGVYHTRFCARFLEASVQLQAVLCFSALCMAQRRVLEYLRHRTQKATHL